MPVVNNTSKPDMRPGIEVHAERDFSTDTVSLYVIDRSRRPARAMVPAGLSRTTHPDEMDVSVRWVEMEEGRETPKFLRVSRDAMDVNSILVKAVAALAGLHGAALPPLVIECDGPQVLRQHVVDEFAAKQPGRSVIVLPAGARVADAPLALNDSNPVAADISRRADLGSAYKRGKRVGLALGGIALALFMALGVTVARVRPEWAIKAVAWVVGQGR